MVRLISISGAKAFMASLVKKKVERKYRGKYYPILKSEWEEPLTDLRIGNNRRIHLHQKYEGALVSVYVVKEGEVGQSFEFGNVILLPQSEWDEIKQSQGKNAGEPLNVQRTGDIYAVSRTGAKARVFVYKDPNNEIRNED